MSFYRSTLVVNSADYVMNDHHHNNNQQQAQLAPHDSYNLTFWSFLLLGLAMSVPYSSVMNSTKTFERRLDTAFFSHFSAVYLTAKFLFIVAAMLFLKKEQMYRVTSVALYGLCMISLLLLVIGGVDDLDGGMLYFLMLLLSLVTSIVSAVVEAGAYGLASAFPPHITQALFIGGAVAGTLSSLISFLLTLYFAEDYSDTIFTWCNFGLGFYIVLSAAFLWNRCCHCDYYIYYQHRIEERKRRPRHHNSHDDVDDGGGGGGEENQHSRLIDVLLKIGDLAIFIFVSGVATMIIWPFIPANTHSVAKGTIDSEWWQGRMFRPLAFLTSAIASLIGKLLPSVPGMHRSRLPFITLALIKCLLILVYMLGNIQLKGRVMLVKPLLANDAFYFFLTAINSISTGYFRTVASMSAPERVGDTDRSMAANIMVFFSYYGDLVGTLFSTIVAVLVKTVLSVPKQN